MPELSGSCFPSIHRKKGLLRQMLCNSPHGFMLHLLGHVDLEHGQHVEDDILDADAQGQTCLLHSGVCALNAAVAVEAVEGAGQIDDKAVRSEERRVGKECRL